MKLWYFFVDEKNRFLHNSTDVNGENVTVIGSASHGSGGVIASDFGILLIIILLYKHFLCISYLL